LHAAAQATVIAVSAATNRVSRGKRCLNATAPRFLASRAWLGLDSAGVGDHGHNGLSKEIIVHRRSVLLSALTMTLAAALAALTLEAASAASWLEMNFYLSGPRYEGVLPPCDYPDALVKISSRFNNKENSFWKTNLKILTFEKIRETAFRPWAANTLPRRFCSGIVEVSDGGKHVIHYSIAEDTGMVGATWGVEWCVVGLDRNWAYNPACRMAQP
jgi:hypothetical protein